MPYTLALKTGSTCMTGPYIPYRGYINAVPPILHQRPSCNHSPPHGPLRPTLPPEHHLGTFNIPFDCT